MRNRGSTGMPRGLALLVAGTLTMVGPVLTAPAWAQATETAASVKEDLKAAKALSRAFQHAADKIGPSVVHITSRTVMRGRDWFGRPLRQEGQGVGSGFVVSRDGYILTNNHVVENSEQVEVRLLDGRKFAGTIVGTDPGTDLAVVKVEATDLTPVEFGESDGLEVGEWVLAVGSPFGTFDHTVTAGIVSAMNRTGLAGEGDKFEEYIQTDAAINPGNSGGPLVNLEGKVVGVNSQIATRSGGSVGIGFSIPSTIARSVMDMIIKKGKVERGWLGITMSDPRTDGSISVPRGEGAVVQQVVPGGPADRAGLKTGDIVLKFNGRSIAGTNRLKNAIAFTPPGSTVSMDVSREGQAMTMSTEVADLTSGRRMATGAVTNERLGLSVATLSRDDARKLGKPDLTGVVVVDVEEGGAAAAAALEPGDVIVGANNTEIEGADQFNKLASKVDLGRPTRLMVIRVQNGRVERGYLDLGGHE